MISPVSTPEFDHEIGFHDYLARFQARFLTNLEAADSLLFQTDTEDLFTVYLDHLPSARQHHSCHACKSFINRYGGLVTIDKGGVSRPLLWEADDATDFYRPAVAELAHRVRRAKVAGVFASKDAVWGQPVTGQWTHFAVTPPAALLHRDLTLTPGQAMAEKLEDYRNVQRALAEYTRPTVEKALTLLESESLYRSEAVIGPAKWLCNLHVARDVVRGHLRDNVTWRAIAASSPGLYRSSMVKTLMDDIAAGMDFGDVSRRFAAKMQPLRYQRPTEAPTAQNIERAEKIVEQMGVADSLARRFARLDEVTAIWRPAAPPAPTSSGVFSHLVPKGVEPFQDLTPPTQTMTWVKFSAAVLPEADEIEYYVPQRGNFAAILTAVNPDAPPIIQWDYDEERNPFSHYVYHNGSVASQWGLMHNRYHKVTAITRSPADWRLPDCPSLHSAQSVIFLLEGAKDSRDSGSGLFPEILRSEFHAIRSTIEAFSRRAKVEGREEASACGVCLQKGEPWNATVRVTKRGTKFLYKLDRWD